MTAAGADTRQELTDEAPRIAPGTAAEVGRVNYLIARAIGAAEGGGPPHLFTTFARHRRLFRRWLGFASALMPGGLLPPADTELVILRVAHDTGCEYEWRHHEHLALTAGVSAEEVQRVREGHDASGWTRRQRLLLRAVDELHAERAISSALWSDLRPLMSDAELIELCFLIGHYEMLAMTLNSLRIEPDSLPDDPARLTRALRSIVARRQRKRRE